MYATGSGSLRAGASLPRMCSWEATWEAPPPPTPATSIISCPPGLGLVVVTGDESGRASGWWIGGDGHSSGALASSGPPPALHALPKVRSEPSTGDLACRAGCALRAMPLTGGTGE